MLIDNLKSHMKPLSNGCVEWTRAKTSDGYGVVRNGSKNQFIHRIVAEQKFGNISGQIVRHTCHNPSCCNPDHLVLGNHQDNMNDMKAAQRQARGVKNGASRLTEKQVLEIKNRFRPGIRYKVTSNAKELASEYNVGVHTIRYIANGSRWSYLNEERH